MEEGVPDIEVPSGGSVEEVERVKVKLYFGATIPFMPVSVEVQVNKTWGEVLESCNIKVVNTNDFILFARNQDLKAPETKPVSYAYLHQKVGVLKENVKSECVLWVIRNGGFIRAFPNDYVEMSYHSTWLKVYNRRFTQICDAPLLSCFTKEDYIHKEIIRNLSHKGNRFRLIPEMDSPLKMRIGLKKNLFDAIKLMRNWGTGKMNFEKTIFDSSWTANELLYVVHFSLSKNKEWPLVNFQVFLALQKAIEAAEWQGFLDKMNQIELTDSATSTSDNRHAQRLFLSDGATRQAVSSCRLLITLLPHVRVRMLHIMIYYLTKVMNNQYFLADARLTGIELLTSFLPYVLGRKWESQYDKYVAVKVLSFLVEYMDELFDSNKELQILNAVGQGLACGMPMEKEGVGMEISEELPASSSKVVSENTSHSHGQRKKAESSEDSMCKKQSNEAVKVLRNKATFEAQKVVFELCLQSNVDKKVQRSRLKEYKARFPDVYAIKNGDMELEKINEEIRQIKLKRKKERRARVRQGMQIFGSIFSPKRKR